MKTMLFWVRKGCRKPMMRGTATAEDSASTIFHMAQNAERGNGKLYIVTGKNAAHGRRIIAAYKAGETPPGTGMKSHIGPNVVALGAEACLAIAGASVAIRKWESRRLAHPGGVRAKDTIALRPGGFDNPENLKAWNPHDATGGGLIDEFRP